MPDPATLARIRERLQALDPELFALDDDSARHAGHAGARSGGHYVLRLVSPRFAGLSRLARHRLVYDALQPLMRTEIHALAMTLLTPAEASGAASNSAVLP